MPRDKERDERRQQVALAQPQATYDKDGLREPIRRVPRPTMKIPTRRGA
jgi:hypothetical protein